MQIQKWLVLTPALFASPCCLLAQNNPVGEQVVAGAASFRRDGTTLTIQQSTDRAIINWSDFSISSGAITRFIQPSAASAVLNRVIGGNLSEIYGSLQANGSVYLINPAGILVGPSGTINSHSFMGATFDVPNSDFLAAAKLSLTGPSTASVENHGIIRGLGGDVFLHGRGLNACARTLGFLWPARG